MAIDSIDLLAAKLRSNDTLLTVGFNLRLRKAPSSPKSCKDDTLFTPNVSSLRDLEGVESDACP